MSQARQRKKEKKIDKKAELPRKDDGFLSLFPLEYPEVKLQSLDDERNQMAPILRTIILACICLLAFSVRLFAVVRWESVIHEFDPYFNYRVTKYLASEGSLDFLNWLDDRAWYPLGRIVGGTVYPGLMATAAVFYWALNAINITINVRNICVFLAPVFAGIAALSTYLFTTEVTNRRSTGLVAAAFIAIVPSYISRSVGGSYDNEGVAIFALVFTFYLWVKAVNTGSLFWGCCCAVSYFYMVAAWGGYVFIINIIPIYVIIMLVAGRYSPRLYVAYNVFYTVGSILAMQVPFVGFNIVTSAECAGSHGVFLLLQVYALIVFLRSHVDAAMLQRVFLLVAGAGVAGVAVALIALQLMGKIQWTGRSLSLLDPTYAKKYIPIIASVSEHQPTTWTSFFFDLHLMVPLAPVGMYFLFQEASDAKVFAILYGTVAWYFAGVMVRLMLTLAPIACLLASVALSEILHVFCRRMQRALGSGKKDKDDEPPGALLTASVLVVMCFLLFFYVVHAVFVSSEAYSSPSIVLASNRPDGSRVIFDDFREAYYWLRMNTDPNAKVMSWWDYGYQLSAMANRTTLVDNNTWNNTHIATVGRAMASSEDLAYPIMRSLDVDYVLVIFGGLTGYQSDDINKFLWMVRIGAGVYPNEIQEGNYFANGQYNIGEAGAPTMLDCLMYKMSYYRFNELRTDADKPAGFDRARSTAVAERDIHFEHLDEAFTSEHWLVRIYKVRPPANRPGGHLGSEAARLAKKKRKKEVLTSLVGCSCSETDLGSDMLYAGGSTGANFNLARHHALSSRRRFFAIARNGQDGHAFAFDKPPRNYDVDSPGCRRPCMDRPDKPCGCSDAGCWEVNDEPCGDETNNRRWAIYELLPDADDEALDEY